MFQYTYNMFIITLKMSHYTTIHVQYVFYLKTTLEQKLSTKIFQKTYNSPPRKSKSIYLT